ncbi:MAG: 4-hydroxy-3-methylbut-2-enyl diphosphate reductase, partial [Bacteroidota bacterium]
MKSFEIPQFYRSEFIAKVKSDRKAADPRKQDFSPTLLDFGPVRFYLARHFGFCYGVENAIERAYKAIAENPGKRIFLLSQMIHNPAVNQDLLENGIRFIMDTEGNMLMDWDELTPEDVVLIPAFGTTIEIEKLLTGKNIDIQTYNTTCPFVEKVWNRSEKLSSDQYTIIIHGKPKHEETRATFSHAAANGHSIVVKDIVESRRLAAYITGELPEADFYTEFQNRYSEGFELQRDLTKVGVVNQTTMLASETQEIADFFRQVMVSKYGEGEIRRHFADTRDTLCYATNDNQEATYSLLKTDADLAIVVGGYNSSNTSHIVDLCASKFPTYFIKSAEEIVSRNEIRHFDYHSKTLQTTTNF